MSIEVTTTWHPEDVLRAIVDGESEVFGRWEGRLVQEFQQRWAGFGQRATGTSAAAWAASLSLEESGVVMTVENTARDRHGRSYVATVTRSGDSSPLIEQVRAEVAASVDPLIADELLDAIGSRLQEPGTERTV